MRHGMAVDQTELKIVVRANPGLVLVKNGVVLEKWAGRDVPSPEELREFLSGR